MVFCLVMEFNQGRSATNGDTPFSLEPYSNIQDNTVYKYILQQYIDIMDQYSTDWLRWIFLNTNAQHKR